MACTVAGITADANILINRLRQSAANYKFHHGEPIPCEQLVQSLCNEKQRYTQVGGLIITFSTLLKLLYPLFQESVPLEFHFFTSDGINIMVFNFINQIHLEITPVGRQLALVTIIKPQYLFSSKNTKVPILLKLRNLQ